MKTLNFKLSACAISVAALLSACGGGGTTPDTTAPTVAITDSVSAATMTSGDVTFTFTFSEAVTDFVTDDVTVTGGTKGAFNMASNGLTATLVVTPTANASGTINVAVAAAKFKDAAGNDNTASASGTQAYNTTTTNSNPPSTANIASFDESSPPAITPFGGATGVIEAPTSGGSGNALKVTRNGGEAWAGAWLAIPTIPSNAGTQIVSARVYSPTAGIPIVAKAEFGDNTGTGDVQATETVVVGWQTLTWRLTNLDATKTYNRFVVLPQLGTQGSGQTFYFDDISVAAAPSSGGGSSNSGGVVTFSSGFTSAELTASGGVIKTAGGSNLDNWEDIPSNNWSGKFSGGSGADSYAGFYYQTPSAPAGLYSQMEVFGPNNAVGFSTTGDTSGVTINGQTKVNFTFNQNAEWYNSANNKFAIVITLGKRYSIGTGCNIQLHGVKTPTSVNGTAYSMNLVNDFRVAQDCGTGITPDAVAQALAASPVVSSVKVIGAGGGPAITGRNSVQSGANLATATTAGVYPTTVVLKGAITFD